MTLANTITDYINAAFTGLWINTREPDEAAREIRQAATEKQWLVYEWDVARGDHKTGQWAGDPQAPLKGLATISKAGTDATTVLILHHFHMFLKNPVLVQELFNRIIEGKTTRAFILIFAPTTTIPLELEKLFVVIDHALPAEQELEDIAVNISEDVIREEVQARGIAKAAAGLTRYEAEGSFALSLARNGAIESKEIWELKDSALKKSGLLKMYRGKEKFADLGGLGSLKEFCIRALHSLKRQVPIRPKGILLLGVPGTGKSAFAKALGNETGRPMLTLDLGATKGSLVGQSEERIRQALKIADAMAPCVLFVDEVEKALAGATGGYQGDGGVSADMFGTLLTWLNDHETDVFFVCTSNDISRLPPEFTRAERFDGIFFIDLPTKAERITIWDQYLRAYSLDDLALPADDTNWTGAEIKACCRLAALLNVNVHDAAKNIVPVATTSAEKVTALREWASGRCLSASTPGLYRHNQTDNQPGTRRRVQKAASAN